MTTRLLVVASFAAAVVGLPVAGACDLSPAVDCALAPVEPAWPGLRYVVAARENGGVRVRGFSGAVPPSRDVVLRASEGEPVVAPSDERGRFDAFLAIDSSTVTLNVDDESAELRVRDREDALACVPGAPLAVGTTPNDLQIARCGDQLLALVAASDDGTLEPAALSDSAPPATATFPSDGDGRPATPWTVALHEDGALAAVPLFGQDAVALVEVCTGRTLQVTTAVDDEGEPIVVEVSPPVTLARAQDADGDGVTESQVSRMLARHPEGAVFAGDRLLVSYTNVLEVGPPARYGPGLVVAFELEGDALAPAGYTILPFQNPQSITLDDDGRPWVSCTGVLERGTASFEAASDGGLVALDAASLAEVQVVDLGRFAPGTPAVTREGIVVGSLLQNRLVRLPLDARELDDGKLLETGAEGTESLFEVLSLGGDLALATGFTTDALYVVDIREGELHPWPFVEPLPLGGDGLFRGLQSLARTPEAALTPGAPDAAALLGLSSEVVPLRLWQVMGP